MSFNAVSGSNLQQLAFNASELFFKVLEAEVHEKVLCHTLSMLSLWTEKFSNEIPNKLIDKFKVFITVYLIVFSLFNFNVLEWF